MRRFVALAVVALSVVALFATQPVASAAPMAATVTNAGTPSWWNGDCDANYFNPQATSKGWTGAGAHRMGAVYLGVPVCGPRPSVDGSPDVLWTRSGWGEYEWECVELAMRFMIQIYGVSPYSANGDSVVRNYRTSFGGGLQTVNNGTPGQPPLPGDIVSFDRPNGFGHVVVVAASNVDSNGNGSITAMSENDTANGWRSLPVNNWVLGGFGNYTPYGWLHDPQGRGGAGGTPLTDGAFVSYQGNVYRLAGGAPIYVSNWSVFGGGQPTITLNDAQWQSLRQLPAEGTFITGAQTGQVFRIVGGAPVYVSTWDAFGGGQPTVTVDQVAIDNGSAGAAAPWNHLNATPADGTFVTGAQTSRVYRFAGGAPLYVSTWSAFGGGQPTMTVDQAAIDNAGGGSPWSHVRAFPVDGTLLTGSQSGQVYKVAGGAPLLVTNCAQIGGCQPTTVVDQWAIDNHDHLAAVPVSGTTLQAVPSNRSWTVTNGCKQLASSGSGITANDPSVTNITTCPPAITISNASVREGNSGTVNMNFTVTLSSPSDQTVSVIYYTQDGTATANQDYGPTYGTLTFNPYETKKVLPISVIGDTLYETNEKFFVNLGGPQNATLADTQGAGTIVNDDPMPSLSINSVKLPEGNSGTKAFKFTVSLSQASGATTRVLWYTADYTATAPSDYLPGSGGLAFSPGQTTKTITVLVNGDTTPEPDETFVVFLDSPVNATLANNFGGGWILNDD